MALSLNYPSPFGGAAFTYFIIGEVRENRYYGHASVVMYGFLDATARQSAANFIPLTLDIGAEIWVKDATISQIYTLVKATPEFANAVDA